MFSFPFFYACSRTLRGFAWWWILWFHRLCHDVFAFPCFSPLDGGLGDSSICRLFSLWPFTSLNLHFSGSWQGPMISTTRYFPFHFDPKILLLKFQFRSLEKIFWRAIAMLKKKKKKKFGGGTHQSYAPNLTASASVDITLCFLVPIHKSFKLFWKIFRNIL